MRDIVTMNEEFIVRAMRLTWERMKIIIEPSSAVPLGSIFEGNQDIKGMRMRIILSSGNID